MVAHLDIIWCDRLGLYFLWGLVQVESRTSNRIQCKPSILSKFVDIDIDCSGLNERRS